MSTIVLKESGLNTRLYAWMEQRFPLAHGILFFSIFLSAQLYGQFLTKSIVVIGPSTLFGFLAAWAFFLTLRILDEHKDYDSDCLHYPQRVLQQGLITLHHLKWVAAGAILLQFVVSLSIDGGLGRITLWWVATAAYAALMSAEFFCKDWLQKHFVLYAFSHMLIMPLSIIWMAQMGAGDVPLPSEILLLAIISFLSGASFELTRKMKGEEEEVVGVGSYSKIFSPVLAAIIVAILLLAGFICQLAIINSIAGESAFYYSCVLVSGLITACYSLWLYQKSPTVMARKRNELWISFSMLTNYLALIVAIVSSRGLSWVS